MSASIETLDFHISDIVSDDIDQILDATKEHTPQFICMCSGNGINHDWIVSSKFVYKVPYLLWDEETHRIEMEKMDELGIPQTIITTMLEEHPGCSVCIDLGSEVWLSITHDKLTVVEYGNNKDINIPDLPRTVYPGCHVRAWLIEQNPQTFNYGPYTVQTGPGVAVTLTHNGTLIYDSSADCDVAADDSE